MLNETNALFFVKDKQDEQISLFIEVYRVENQIYLSGEDVKDYLLAGKRKNKNRMIRYKDGKQVIICSREMLIDFVRDALEGKIPDLFAVYGKVDDNLANIVYKKSFENLNVKGSYLELSANDLFHAHKHSRPMEEGDIELYSKSAGSLRFKTEWAISDKKYEQKYKSSSNSAGS